MKKTRGILIALFVFLSLAMAVSAYAQPPNQVIDIRVVGTAAVDIDLCTCVIPLQVGDTYSPEKLAQAEKYLNSWGLFDSVKVSAQHTPEGVIVLVELKDATIVAQIDISGNYPYIENKVRKYLTVHAGDVYTPEKIEEQVERLKEFYKREGYNDTEIAVSEEPGPEEHQVIVGFHIHKGFLLRYRWITVDGNRAYPDGRFVSAINPYQPYSEKRLRNSLRELREFYHFRGYPRAKIRIREKKIYLEKRRVDLVIDIHEGPYVDVRFIGNTHASTTHLKNTITIFREGNFDSYEIEESVKALETYYRAEGFPDVKIEAERTKINDDHIIIAFFIDQGSYRYVKQIRFEGTEGISDSKLSDGMITKRHGVGEPGALLEKNVAQDSKTVAANLRKEGYLDAQVEPWEVGLSKQGYAYEVTVPIEEGPRTIVHAITFSGNKTATEEQLLEVLELKSGKPFNPDEVEDDLQKIKLYFADRGHPYAKASQDVAIDETSHAARISYTIDEGPEVQVGQILIIGDVLTSQKAIKNAMELKPGDPFSYEKLVESQLNIRRLGAFNSVRIETIGIEEKEKTVHLKVSVDEQRPFRIDAEVGYSTRDDFIGSLIFTNINSFGWAKKTFLKLTGGKKLSRVELGWQDPRFIDSNFEMSVITWIQYRQRPTYTYNQLGGVLGFYRRYDRLGLIFLQEFTRNYFVEGDSIAADADSLRNNTISLTSASASYDARDSFSDPTKGYYGLARIDLFNEIAGQNAHFVEFTLQAEYDIGFWKRFVFSSAGRFSDIETIGSNVSVPTNELLYMGGSDTVRGYAEDSLGPRNALGQATGGRIRWIINEELRLRIARSFQFAGFFDVGSLTNSFSQISTVSTRTSAGFGLRYVTPVGPLRLDVGFPLDRSANEDRYRVHFTFGYVF